MMRRILPISLVAALLLLTALAAGIAQGQMAQGEVFSALGVCSDDADVAAPCLECALAGGLPVAEGGAVPDPATGAGALRRGGRDLVVAGRPVWGGGARAPPGRV